MAVKEPISDITIDEAIRQLMADPQQLNYESPYRFGAGKLLSKGEHEQTETLHRLVQGYANQESVKRPLCVALFGPPGSGKSSAVRQMCDEVRKHGPLRKLATINLTQIDGAEDLARALKRVTAGKVKDVTIPVVFFDEFDAPRRGAPYGWLDWFLAPMHDGVFMHQGKEVSLTRAIYFFAGGTAATMAEFSARAEDPAFVAAKGPDFVSRLRGFLNVCGPNDAPRVIRRATSLQHELRERAELVAAKDLRPSEELLRSMLHVGRYCHGRRSIAAILEMSTPMAVHAARRKQTRALDFQDLPPDELLALHTDRGALDPQAIGGAIAFSGYGADDGRDIKPTWQALAGALWQEGATLSYGGRWGADGQELTNALANEAGRLPRALTAKPRRHVTPRLRCFLAEGAPDNLIEGVEVVRSGVPNPQLETMASGPTKLMEAALFWFRTRMMVGEASVAQVVVGGKTSNFLGRWSGIAEEVMVSLSLGRPVYVAGGFEGAASDVGRLLGLGRSWLGEPLATFASPVDKGLLALLRKHADGFRPPPYLDLPIHDEELVEFLKQHAIGGPKWPNNGLTVEENRELFTCTDAGQIAELVTRGLVRRFGRRS